jgi:hypothetical protein
MTIAPVGAAPPQAAGAAAPRAGFAAALDGRLAPRPAGPGPTAVRPHPTAATSAPAAEPRSAPGAPWGAALATVERAQSRLDAVLAAARAGRTFTSAELLALQAEAYRCAQVVDLGAKLAEQGAQAVKQALNTQL